MASKAQELLALCEGRKLSRSDAPAKRRIDKALADHQKTVVDAVIEPKTKVSGKGKPKKQEAPIDRYLNTGSYEPAKPRKKRPLSDEAKKKKKAAAARKSRKAKAKAKKLAAITPTHLK